MEGVRITPDAVNNTLLIYADMESYRLIESTLRQVDRPQLQVSIDATIAEVTLNDALNYGVQTYLTSKNLGLKPDNGSFLNTTSTSAPAAAAAGTAANAFLNRAFPGFNFLIGSESQPSMILDALHTVTDLKVLSNPSLVVIDNQVATLQVGDQVPVSTGSATVLTTSNTVVNTVEARSRSNASSRATFSSSTSSRRRSSWRNAEWPSFMWKTVGSPPSARRTRTPPRPRTSSCRRRCRRSPP